jgi:hypothetical protein
MLGYSEENMSRLKSQADAIDLGTIEKAIKLISEYINIGRYSERPRILLETVAVRLADGGIYEGVNQTGASRTSSAARSVRMAAETSAAAAGKSGGSPVKAGIHTAAADAKKNVHTEPNAGKADAEPIESIASAPREVPGDAADMWYKIVDTIAASDRSFVSQLGRHASGSEYESESGELIITVKPQKMRTANDRLGDISRAAKAIYGSEVFVTLREGEPEQARRAAAVTEAQQEETSRIIDEDINVNDVVSDIQSLFGIKPEVTG